VKKFCNNTRDEADSLPQLFMTGFSWPREAIPQPVLVAGYIFPSDFAIDGYLCSAICGAFMYAFDLIELNGDDLRRDPLEVRKVTLANIIARAGHGIWFNDHIEEEDGETVFRHACKLGFEGIVSKRLGSPYLSGRSRHWIKSKNPAAPAVRREAEEDWGR
jgi:ATP dependent DNA ligase domain